MTGDVLKLVINGIFLFLQTNYSPTFSALMQLAEQLEKHPAGKEYNSNNIQSLKELHDKEPNLE